MAGTSARAAVAPRRKTPDPDRYSVPVVRSTFKILREISAAGGLALNEVTQKTGVSKSTAFRVLSTLVQLGYVVRDDGHTYSIDSSLGNLANRQAINEVLRRVALPHMLSLRNDFGETVNLGVLSLDKVEYIEVVPSEYALRFSEKPGFTVQAHASALGKAILAYAADDVVDSLIGVSKLPVNTRNTIADSKEFKAELKRVREKGIAFDKGETTLLARCIAAPILNETGSAMAAISISGPSSRFNPSKNLPVIERLQKAVEEISRQLEQRPKPNPVRPAKKGKS